MHPAALLLQLLLLPASHAQIPPLGPIPGGLRPLSDPTFSIHHCQYIASFSPTQDGNPDFAWIFTAGLSGAPSTYSFESSGFPGFYLGLKSNSSGALGLINPPTDGTTAAAATFVLAAPLAPPPPGTPSVFSLVSQAEGPWHGQYVTFASSSTAPCGDPAPSGDALLTDASAVSKDRATIMLGAAAPQPTLHVTVATRNVTNPSVSKRFMGCASMGGASVPAWRAFSSPHSLPTPPPPLPPSL